jgi:beta-phosphoglucomutase
MIHIPDIGDFSDNVGFIPLEASLDGLHRKGQDGVVALFATGDRKVEFHCYTNYTIAYVPSLVGIGAYYPIAPIQEKKPIKYVLMDLDGTSVKSEEFWVWIIELTMQSLLKNPLFHLNKEDLPNVSGHSVSEHLQYCINKYAPGASLDEARGYYFEHTHHEMDLIAKGQGKKNAFVPAPGLKEFLLTLKKHGIKIGLVTSGLYEKAWPEIYGAFQSLNMGDPREFYDCIISAGSQLKKGQVGTLGELSPKPHPWLYAETGIVGLGIKADEHDRVVGIEDSGAGVCSIRLAGFTVLGVDGGNIVSSGTKALCAGFEKDLMSLLPFIL